MLKVTELGSAETRFETKAYSSQESMFFIESQFNFSSDGGEFKGDSLALFDVTTNRLRDLDQVT